MRSTRALLFASVLILAASPSPADELSHVWSQRFGDSEYQSGNAVAVDEDGSIVLAGSFMGSINLGGGWLTSQGSHDIFLAKFDPDGNHLWSQRFGNSSSQQTFFVSIDASGSILLTGGFYGTVNFGGSTLVSNGLSDVFVAKFYSNGAHRWSRSYGNADYQQGFCALAGGGGTVIVTGRFEGTVDFGGGPLTSAGSTDIFLLHLDASDGHHLYSARYGDASEQVSRAMAVDHNGRTVISGYFAGSVNFGGGTLTSAGGYDTYLAMFEPSGAHAWSQRFGSPEQQLGMGLAMDALGRILFCGAFENTINLGGGTLTSAGEYDMFLASFDLDGDHLWSQRFGGTGSESSQGVATDFMGDVVTLAGRSEGGLTFGGDWLTGAGGDDICVAAFDGDGEHLDSQIFGNSANQEAKFAAIDDDGNILVTGSFEGSVSFGGGTLTSSGSGDAFLVKFGPLNQAVPEEVGARCLALQASPSLVGEVTRLTYGLPRSSPVHLGVYDAEGRMLQRLVHGPQEAGRHAVEWHPETLRDLPSSTVRFIRLVTSEGEATTRILLLR